jgi:outer membrane protein assembly factor BamB
MLIAGVRFVSALMAFIAVGAVASPAPSASAARWVAPIDSRDRPGDWVAVRDNVAYVARDGRVEALDLTDGHVRWSTRMAASNHIVARSKRVLVPVANGYVILDRATGAVTARRVMGANVEFAGTTHFLMLHDETLLRGISDDGTRTLWERRLPVTDRFAQPVGDDAVGLFDTRRSTVLVIDAANGHAVASVDGVDELVGADGRYLWFNVRNGGIKGVDLRENRTVVVHDSIVRGAVRVEHGVAVAVLHGRLSVLDLRTGARPKPLHVIGRWIGGPVDGRIFLERSDGLYEQALDSAKTARVARYTGQSRIVTSDGRHAFVGLEDGQIFTIDVADAREIGETQTSCRAYEGFKVLSAQAFVHCDDASARSQFVPLTIAGRL